MYYGGPNKALDHTRLLCMGNPYIIAIPKSICGTPHSQAWRRISPLDHSNTIGSIGNNAFRYPCQNFHISLESHMHYYMRFAEVAIFQVC